MKAHSGKPAGHLLRIASAWLLAGFPAVQVQEARAAVGAAQAAGNSLEEIIVTARHRNESMQDVPIAVSAISKSLIRDLRVEGVQDIAALIPGLGVGPTTSSAGGGLYLRGIGSGETGAFIDQGLAITIDGVQLNDARVMHASMLDLEQIEVLRGPQALFYGKNSTAGVVAIRTADPGDEFEAIASAAYEFAAQERIGRLILSGPVTDTLGARLAISYSEADGMIDVTGVDAPLTADIPLAVASRDRTYDNREDLFVRATLLFEPTDTFMARAKFGYVDRLGGGISWGGQRSTCPYGAAQAIILMDACKMDNKVTFGQIHPSIFAMFPQADASRPDGTLDSTQQLGSLEMDYKFGGGLSLTSLTGYYDSQQFVMAEGTWEPVSLVVSIFNVEIEHLSQEVRLSSDWDGPFNFLAGAYYERRDSTYDHLVAGSAVLGQRFLGEAVAFSLGEQTKGQKATSTSALLQVDWDITDQLRASLGGRYSIEEKDVVATGNGVRANLQPDNEEWTNFSPELALSYRPLPGLMLYASYKRGFKSGGFDSSFQANVLASPSAVDLVYDEEHVTGYEVGFKSTLFGDSLTFNGVLFSYDYEDLQVSVTDPVALSNRILNAAASTVEGVELEAVWAPHSIDHLRLRASLNYLDNTYGAFIGDCYTGQTIALGCNQNFNAATGNFTSQDLSGRDMLFSPQWSGGAGVEYEIGLAGEWRLGLTGYAAYTGDYETMVQYMPGADQKSFWEIHSSVRVFSGDEHWQLGLQGRNLTDKYYKRRTDHVPLTGNGFGTATATYSDLVSSVVGGRTVTLDLTYRF